MTQVTDAGRYRYVTYIRCYTENVTMERDFSQDHSHPNQRPVRPLFVLQKLAGKHEQV